MQPLKRGQTNFVVSRFPATVESFEDLGQVETPNGPKMICQFVYKLDATNAEGQHRRIAEKMNQSLSDKATLYARVAVILGEVPETLDPPALLEKAVVVLTRVVVGKDGKPGPRVCGLEPPTDESGPVVA
jgi:hypothetical protein